MVRCLFGVAALAVLLGGLATTRADELGPEIDLTSLDDVVRGSASDWSDANLQQVAWGFGAAPRRFYASAMIGPSFATFTSPSTPSLASDGTVFTAGGALGVAFDRARGQLRLEVEGMGRDTYNAPFTSPPRPGNSTILTNNWSVLANLWRDYMFTEQFGVYGGGGIGAGGYILGERLGGVTEYVDPASNFAWQAGGGLLWEVTDRLTFDVGYRYFRINTIEQAAFVNQNLFQASELMFTLRFYEPFRGWRR